MKRAVCENESRSKIVYLSFIDTPLAGFGEILPIQVGAFIMFPHFTIQVIPYA